eukprot:SAG22_NODE_19611_length_273_cov_0.804598_1_plen_78_part_01
MGTACSVADIKRIGCDIQTREYRAPEVLLGATWGALRAAAAGGGSGQRRPCFPCRLLSFLSVSGLSLPFRAQGSHLF